MADVSGQHGGLVPSRQPFGRRVLLPYEVELCETLGLSEEDYWYFVELTQAYNGQRHEAYELAGVPDIQNPFLVPILINIVIGIALTAIGALLAPKPKAIQPKVQTPQQQQEAPQLKTADITGASRFTATQGFDSVQELASLGEVIPLVFANRSGNAGGIRVKSLLLWSQLLSYGTGQQLKVLLLLSSGELARDPDFAGYAIGDQTLKNYSTAKVALYRLLNGGRIQEANRYSEGTLEPNQVSDVFTVYDDVGESFKEWFSGTRSPSTQTEFGCFAPMPNGGYYKLSYELVVIPSAWNGGLKNDANVKKEKLARNWTCRTSLSGKSDTTVTLTIAPNGEDPNAYAPWGLEDVNASVQDIRIAVDDNLQLGSLYMAGSAQVVCVAASTTEIWELPNTKTYTLRIEEPGEIETYDPYSASNEPYGYHFQRLAIGTVSNNRKCDITEIGLKSNVWKQITGFPNVNSQPDGGTIARYENDNGSIQLGNVQRYHNRISFFRLQCRPLGTTDTWHDLSGGKIFAVKGNTPQPQYNFIRVRHPYGQYEFRFVPVPGCVVVRHWRNKNVNLLCPGSYVRYTHDDKVVTFTGQVYRLTDDRITNPDWVVGSVPPPATGRIINISPRSTAGTARPVYTTSNSNTEERYDGSNYWIDYVNVVGTPYQHQAVWDGRVVGGAGGSDGGVNTMGLGKGSFRQSGSGWKKYSITRTTWSTSVNEYPPTASGTFPLQSPNGSGGTIYVVQWGNGHTEFSLASGGSTYLNGEQAPISAFGTTYTFTLTTDAANYINNSLNIYDAVADWHKYDAERTSHMDGPEHSIVYVNEQIIQSTAPQYSKLALLGLRLNATKEWSSFQQLSAYVKQGVKVERLLDDNGNPTTSLVGPTNNFAEIAYALLTDETLGAGKILGKAAVDRERMTIAARFCRANGFTWDGIVGQRLNLREFIFENAGYNLLDFTILGGQFSLVPSVPYGSDFKLNNSGKPDIKALFTDGNIRELKVTWLSPEERQLFKAVVKWRQETENGFAQERLVQVRLADSQGGSDSDPEESFDLSGFCTQQDHALTFAYMALKLRKEVDHGLTFETTPQAAMGMAPGEYFRLVSTVTHTSRFNNGVINAEGTITSTETLSDGNHDVLVWQPGTVGVSEAVLEVSAGKAQAALWGHVFTLRNSTTTSRVYKVETLTYTDEGFVQVAASYQPLTASGSLATLDWDPAHFVVEVG